MDPIKALNWLALENSLQGFTPSFVSALLPSSIPLVPHPAGNQAYTIQAPQPLPTSSFPPPGAYSHPGLFSAKPPEYNDRDLGTLEYLCHRAASLWVAPSHNPSIPDSVRLLKDQPSRVQP
ncbi:hypothetical protein H696_01551 [Fonticula alba]|uniref:Uncharacterized protein n=1 Tax=Fonticula alba TaxID=691883 RepID=A0A058ZF90_FONAL|nr:hypothetical protein H696_01551 [Fonticula alba]KCV72147.1 hypothetical protein H696_01551 [Fonticula alba]|eukprot:XP_009493725.1 hypothetical protein H696_01551 [Fonticula alba]